MDGDLPLTGETAGPVENDLAWRFPKQGGAGAPERRLTRGEKRRLKLEEKRQRRRATRKDRVHAKKDARRAIREETFEGMSPEERAHEEERQKEVRIARHHQMVAFLEQCYNNDNGLKVAINCSFDKLMTDRERFSLGHQLNYVFQTLKSELEHPVQIHLTSFTEGSELAAEFARAGSGKWRVHSTAQPFWEIFPEDSVVILSPDAEETLDGPLDVSKIYVIGGLVDRAIAKNQTWDQARELRIAARKLPLRKYMPVTTGVVLNINTVVEILREVVRNGGDWAEAFKKHVPHRKQGSVGPRGLRKRLKGLGDALPPPAPTAPSPLAPEASAAPPPLDSAALAVT